MQVDPVWRLVALMPASLHASACVGSTDMSGALDSSHRVRLWCCCCSCRGSKGAAHRLGHFLADDVLVQHGLQLPRQRRLAQASSRHAGRACWAGAPKVGDSSLQRRSLQRLRTHSACVRPRHCLRARLQQSDSLHRSPAALLTLPRSWLDSVLAALLEQVSASPAKWRQARAPHSSAAC